MHSELGLKTAHGYLRASLQDTQAEESKRVKKQTKETATTGCIFKALGTAQLRESSKQGRPPGDMKIGSAHHSGRHEEKGRSLHQDLLGGGGGAAKMDLSLQFRRVSGSQYPTTPSAHSCRGPPLQGKEARSRSRGPCDPGFQGAGPGGEEQENGERTRRRTCTSRGRSQLGIIYTPQRPAPRKRERDPLG